MNEIKLATPKPVAKVWMAYLVTVFFTLVCIFSCLSIKKFIFDKDMVAGLIYAVMALSMTLCMCIMNMMFSWYYGAELAIKNGFLVYSYYQIVGLNKSKDIYRIKTVKKYRKSGGNIQVFGEIYMKEPLRKEKLVDKCKLYDCSKNPEVEEMLKYYIG